MLTEFIVGEKYTNDQIRFALNVENLGGIRPSVDKNKKLNHLAILTTTEMYEKNISENPYKDRIENNILIYTALFITQWATLDVANKTSLNEHFRYPFLKKTGVS